MNNSQSVSFSFESEKQRFLSRTYAWMCAGFLVSAFFAYAGAWTPLARISFNPLAVIVLSIGELALVFILSAKIRTLSVGTASAFFVIYSALNGLTLSSIFMIYSISSIFSCFLSAAAMFFLMSVYGAVTKRNLGKFARFLSGALIGILIASFLNFLLALIFPQNFLFGGFDFLISICAVVIFAGLSAFDTQRVFMISERANSSNDFKKLSIIAALELYLDFINIFLYLLRIFARRERS